MADEKKIQIRAAAKQLARPRLEEMRKDELVALAAKHGVALPKTVKKAEIVVALADQQAVCEDVLGV